MSATAVIISAAVVCCLATIAIVVAVSLHFKVAAEEACTMEEFHDLNSSVVLKENFLTTRNRFEVFDANNAKVGGYTTRPAFTKTVYCYRDIYDHVVAQAEKSAFSWTYRITLCNPVSNSSYFELELVFFTLGTVEHKLYKNGVLFGYTSKKTWFTCKPDIAIETPNGQLLATATRSCLGSFFTDSWNVTNYQPNILPNYVAGFIPYITTQQENAEEQAAAKKKKSKRADVPVPRTNTTSEIKK